MKKLISLVLALVFIFTFAACSSTVAVNSEIKGYFDEGYVCTMTTSNGEIWSGILEKDGKYIKVTSPITKRQQEAFNELDVSDEGYEIKEEKLITSLKDATCEDMTSKIPAKEELDKFVGKTLGDMESAGFENIGTVSTDEAYVVTFDGPVYQINVTVADEVDLSDLDNYSPKQINNFKIGSVEFVGFSWSSLNQ